jgi:hypothetical protein
VDGWIEISARTGGFPSVRHGPIRRMRLGLKVADDATVFPMPGSLSVLDDTIAMGSRPSV